LSTVNSTIAPSLLSLSGRAQLTAINSTIAPSFLSLSCRAQLNWLLQFSSL
jgi:hypothetical protein